MNSLLTLPRILLTASFFSCAAALAAPAAAQLFPLSSVRITTGPFAQAIAANRTYLLKHDPDRLLAPFRREVGLTPKAPPYPDWESLGLDGHTAGHYLSALAGMIAEGADTPDGELRRRLDYLVAELEACQQAAGDGYIGGVPGGRAMWQAIRTGNLQANSFGLNGKWVPWYNLHKMFAGLRDATLLADSAVARRVWIRYGEWCDGLVAGLSDAQMQDMLRAEQGGMVEVLADLAAVTGDAKFLRLSRRFIHHAVIDPLVQQEDRLTGLHANTQIPKIIGIQRLGTLDGDASLRRGARFFWDTVTQRRSVAFGGNSVSEHFNDVRNFRGLLEHREGPETCNSYNMLRLTEQLFQETPEAGLVDYYERTLYNHILASIETQDPGYVYFTPIRPGHYRVYSVPEKHFWCCVGSGMENPARYGQFIYARGDRELFLNLFIASEVNVPEWGLTLRQETAFPETASTRLRLKLAAPAHFALKIRRPAWATAAGWQLKVNGVVQNVSSSPGAYASLAREWKEGDVVDVEMPMTLRVEGLPDGSAWKALLYGPLVMASPVTAAEPVESRSGEGRSAHIAKGTLLPLDQFPVVLCAPSDVPSHVQAEPAAGPLHFRLRDVLSPQVDGGLALVPFYQLQRSRYQMYFEFTTPEGVEARRRELAEAERVRLARDAATVDAVAVGEQQPEVDHAFVGEDTESGEFQGRHWRHGRVIQYTLATGSAKALELSVTYSGNDRDRNFDIFINGQRLATERLTAERPGEFFERRYLLPPSLLEAGAGRVVVRFQAHEKSLAGGLFDVRLLKVETAQAK